MGVIKYQGAFGIAKAANYTAEPSIAGAKYLPCTDANIELTPRVYRQMGAWVPEARAIVPNGFEPSAFSANGIEVNCNIAGYLFYLALGGDQFATSVHTITPDNDLPICAAWLDRMVALTTGGSPSKVQALVGGKIGQFSFEQAENEYAKMSISGIGCQSKASTNLTLTPAFAAGVNNEPLGWHHLRVDTGYLKIGLNAGALAADLSVTGFKINGTRNLVPGNPALAATPVPERIESGARVISFEITKEFYGANAEAQIQAFLAQQQFAFEVQYDVGTYYIKIALPVARVVGNPMEAGGASDDLPVLTFPCECWNDGSTDPITVSTLDGSSALYA